jgi:hypothetical protein
MLLFSGRIRSFPTENFFSNRLFLWNFFQLQFFVVVYSRFFNRNLFSTNLFSTNLFSTGIYFQPKFISAEIYFQPKFIFNRNLFQPKFIFNRKLFSAEIYFQPKFIFNRNFVISHELPLMIMLQRNMLTWQRHVFQAFSHCCVRTASLSLHKLEGNRSCLFICIQYGCHLENSFRFCPKCGMQLIINTEINVLGGGNSQIRSPDVSNVSRTCMSQSNVIATPVPSTSSSTLPHFVIFLKQILLNIICVDAI